MFRRLRQSVIQSLWEIYLERTPQMQLMQSALKSKGLIQPILDHFAIIDLPGTYSGIDHLSKIFTMLGYQERGRDYLPSKQNDFLWMAEADCQQMPATEVLPQVVVADFRLNEMPLSVKTIIAKYADYAQPFPFERAQYLLDRALAGDDASFQQLEKMIVHYLTTKDWPTPSLNEYRTVQEFNELIAWVLVFGRQPNHFTLSIHLLKYFRNFEDFQSFVESEVKLPLNGEGGKVKGSAALGIKQGSTQGMNAPIQLADHEITIPTGFVEFVWRYPLQMQTQGVHEGLWKDFYSGFIAQQANHVIESLYVRDESSP